MFSFAAARLEAGFELELKREPLLELEPELEPKLEPEFGPALGLGPGVEDGGRSVLETGMEAGWLVFADGSGNSDDKGVDDREVLLTAAVVVVLDSRGAVPSPNIEVSNPRSVESVDFSDFSEFSKD